MSSPFFGMIAAMLGTMKWARSIAIVGGVLLAASPASAEEAPWSAGVTEARKTAAQKLLEEGNARFVERNYSTALEKYTAAVKSWDHPAIRFNIVRCLIQLDKPIEASDQLKLALKYGAKPLEEAVYNEALAYEKLLANQIGELELKCDQPGVTVTFDGQKVGTCPHSEKIRVAPGEHQLVGTREGFLTRTVDVVIIGGKVVSHSVSLDPLTKAARVVHRYPAWVPWAVFGGGLIVAGAGGLMNLKAASDMDIYDRQIASACADQGCTEEELAGGLSDQRDSALRLNKIAIGVMVVGAVTAVTGGVMLYLNRGKTVYAESRESIGDTKVTVIPTADGALMTMFGRF